jgi:hypothetical protein
MAGTILRANSVNRIGEGIPSAGFDSAPKGFCEGTETLEGITKNVTNKEGGRQLTAA